MRAAGAGLCAVLAWAVPAAAQVTLPGPAQIPQAQQRFQPPPPEPHANPAAPVNPPLATAPPPGAQDVRFVLRDITFQGLTVYSPAQLRPLYAPLVGRTISLADLYALAGRITDQYRHDGYLISVAVVPAQPVENGAVTIRIVEGFVDKLRFGGGVDGPKDVLQDLAAPVTASRPLRADDLERSILLIGDLPGVNAQSVLSPSATTFGAADLDVVIQQTPWEGFVSFDNLGSRFLGPYALSAGASEYSRLGLYEQVDLTLALDPIEQTMAYVQGAITVPVVNTGPLAGSTLQVSGLYSRAKPDLPAAVFPFETRSANAEGRLTWFSPLIRSRDQNLSARLAFIWRDLENRITDLPADLRNPAAEHVRVLQPRLTYDVVDGWDGTSIVDLVGNIGLGILGASRNSDPRLIRQDGDGQFFYLSGMAARLQPLTENVSLLLRADFQVSGEPLPTTERFGVGGFGGAAGYAPGNITGDSGLNTRIEARYGHDLPETPVTGFQLYGYYDYGFTADRTAGPQDWNSLSTVGLGIRMNLFETLSFNPEIAYQLSGRPADCLGCAHETRFLFNVTKRF